LKKSRAFLLSLALGCYSLLPAFISRPPSKSSKSPDAAAGSFDGSGSSFLSPPKLNSNSSSFFSSLFPAATSPKSKPSRSLFASFLPSAFYYPVANFSNPAPKSNSSVSAADFLGFALIFS